MSAENWNFFFFMLKTINIYVALLLLLLFLLLRNLVFERFLANADDFIFFLSFLNNWDLIEVFAYFIIFCKKLW